MMESGKRQRRLSDGYSFAGFRANETVRGVFGDPDVRILRLDRRSKKRFAAVAGRSGTGGTTGGCGRFATCRAQGFGLFLESECGASRAVISAPWSAKGLDFLADNPHFTKRFAFYVGRRCRQASIRDVAKELKLDWDTVKTLEMQNMRAQLAHAGTPGPRAIGIDEISVRKGHSYRIVVSDLVRKRPIWFGGEDRSEASMAAFYDWLGPKKSRQIRLAV